MSKLRVLVACERSGVVRRAFRALGHIAYSCDLEPADDGSEYHYQDDAVYISRLYQWDLMICHPECTFIALCQIWRKHPSKADAKKFNLSLTDTTWRMERREEGVKFAKLLWEAPIPHICLENPKSILSTRMTPKSQTIHPWQFGHGEKKETWLWLKNLPKLVPTNIVDGREERVWKMTPGPNRSAARSITYEGIASAMATQWSAHLTP